MRDRGKIEEKNTSGWHTDKRFNDNLTTMMVHG